MSRPAVSQHLKVLKDAGLVIDRAAGPRRIYQLDPDGVGALRGYLDQFWKRSLAAYKVAVERHEEDVPYATTDAATSTTRTTKPTR